MKKLIVIAVLAALTANAQAADTKTREGCVHRKLVSLMNSKGQNIPQFWVDKIGVQAKRRVAEVTAQQKKHGLSDIDMQLKLFEASQKAATNANEEVLSVIATCW